MTIRKLTFSMLLFFFFCSFGSQAFGQQPNSVLENPPPLAGLVAPLPASPPATGCGCNGAEWSNPLFEDSSLFVLKQVGEQTIFAVRNPLDFSQAFSISLIWDVESNLIPSIVATITAEPAVDDPDWCAGVCGLTFNWHHLIPKSPNASPCMHAAIDAYNIWAIQNEKPEFDVDCIATIRIPCRRQLEFRAGNRC